MKRPQSILWLDDDEVLKFIADQLLSSFPEQISRYCFFINGFEALSYLEESEASGTFPDLLLIDLKMPQMDGFEFLHIYCDRFYHKHPQSNVFVLSSSLLASDVEKSKSFPCVRDYIIKPLTREKLNQLLEANGGGE